MKLRHVRCLLVLFLALFAVNSIAAAARACTLSQVRHEHGTLQRVQVDIDPTCPEAVATLCATHCVQEAKSAEQKVPAVDAPPAALAPPLLLAHATFFREQYVLPALSSPPVVGPPLTILFGNFRN